MASYDSLSKNPVKNQKKTRLAYQKTRFFGEVAKKPEKTNKKPG